MGYSTISGLKKLKMWLVGGAVPPPKKVPPQGPVEALRGEAASITYFIYVIKCFILDEES